MLEIYNYYERLVDDHLWKMAQDPDRMLSQVDLEDIACIVLNRLPPCYVRNLIDKAAHLSEKQYQEMHKQVSDAIEIALEQVLNRRSETRN